MPTAPCIGIVPAALHTLADGTTRHRHSCRGSALRIRAVLLRREHGAYLPIRVQLSAVPVQFDRFGLQH
jgi:hypothetical protein